ncbi:MULTISPECIES: hypothetical protein [Microcystis]|uniref:ABC transporter permease n=1 Tax=Microcystis viridis FACHB-1342 TaxID=2692900 RepID=A0ABR8GBF2_MICVR|nr:MULTISPECIES: hypothetical protein [Microcystis]MBD2600500.1 hypothetical protein [Microcystis viridis FACHB-1342]ODV39417.1 hypothetical protein BFG60_1071 [Microcystis aeruginosa NIES-98]
MTFLIELTDSLKRVFFAKNKSLAKLLTILPYFSTILGLTVLFPQFDQKQQKRELLDQFFGQGDLLN